MKKWLKSLFRGNSLDEIEEEFEEKPSEGIYQSHSIDKKKSDEFERPNFRFPLQLDEELPPQKKEETKVEPVFHQQKNYDFWQSQTQTLDRLQKEETYPTYNQSNNIYENSVSIQYENNVLTNKTEQLKPKVDDEKVDIVFRPKRKTPFRPSEYISPIYGYQKPTSKDSTVENETTVDISENTDSVVVESLILNQPIDQQKTNLEVDVTNVENQQELNTLNNEDLLDEPKSLQTDDEKLDRVQLESTINQSELSSENEHVSNEKVEQENQYEVYENTLDLLTDSNSSEQEEEKEIESFVQNETALDELVNPI
jgi:DNA segregation ATPase FtsK/SpoIIIE, S-DNA-T family